MKRFSAAAMCGIALLLILGTGTKAGPESCRDVLDQYKSAKSEVVSALDNYTSCIHGSDGHEDCSSEFSTLQSAQDEFESAVSEYESECQ
jgi:hypothetical protein